MLRADNLGFRYGAGPPVLQGVSLTLARGTVLGLIGPNGSGKTTTLRLLAGSLGPTSGCVSLDGRDLKTFPRKQLARRIAVVPQDTHLSFDFRVLEVALMGRHPYLGPFEFEGPADLAAATRALTATSVEQLADRHFATLSGGEQQRVVIASALTQFDPESAHEQASCRFLLLDEPTTSLDLHHQLKLSALLARLNQTHGISIVVSTHDLNFAASVCHQLVLLRQGVVLATGPTAQVLTREAIRDLYEVEADVQYHEGAGHVTVVPLTGA